MKISLTSCGGHFTGAALVATAWLFLAIASHSRSQTAVNPVTKKTATELPNLIITAKAEETAIKIPYLPPVEGTKIYSGKRTSVIEMKALPQIVSNNYRQAFALTPGLLVSEETTPMVSFGYRGIGSPDRAQFLQTGRRSWNPCSDWSSCAAAPASCTGRNLRAR